MWSGRRSGSQPICIGPDDDMEARRNDIAEAIAEVDDGSGVIILTDLFGGTPSNLAISLMKPSKIEVIAGINLPMLIRLEGARKTMDVKRRGRRRARGGPQIYLGRVRRSSGRRRSERGQPHRRGHATSAASTPAPAPSSSPSPPASPPRSRSRRTASKVCGTSIMGLMMLGAAKGDTITISAEGDGAEQAVDGAGRTLVEAPVRRAKE